MPATATVFVDDDVDEAAGKVDQCGGGADAYDAYDYGPAQPEAAAGEVKGMAAVGEVEDGDEGKHSHGYVGGYGGPLDSPAEHEDEERAEQEVEARANEHGHHGLDRIA